MRTFRTILGAALLVALLAMPAAAQATKAEWLLAGQTFSELKLEKEKLTFAGGPLTISTAALGGLVFKCEAAKGGGTAFSGGTAEYSIELSKCTTKLKGKELPACKVKDPLTLKAEPELVLATNSAYQKLKPTAKEELLGTIELGEECSIGETISITGSVAGLDSLEPGVKHQLEFSEGISETENKESGAAKLELHILKTIAYIEGSVTFEASGAKAGELIVLVPDSKLCEVLGGGSCPVGKNYLMNSAVKLVNENNMIFSFNSGVVNCTGSKLEGSSLASTGVPVSITVATFTTCTNCTVDSLNRPYPARIYHRNLLGKGFIEISALELKFVCSPTLTCIYRTTALQFAVTGANPNATARRVALSMNKVATGSSMACDMNASWEGEGGEGDIKYKFAAPAPLFLTG